MLRKPRAESTLWKYINIERRIPQTCRGSFVSLCGLAGRTNPYSIHTRHAEAIVDVAVEFEDGGDLVPRYSEQLLPVSWFPLALLVLNDKLCWQAERQSDWPLIPMLLERTKDCLSNHHAENSSNPSMGFCIPTNNNSCLGESIIYLYCFIIAILIPHAMARTVINVCIDTCVDKRSSYL